MARRILLLLLSLLLLVVAAACGAGEPVGESATTSTTTAPSVTAAAEPEFPVEVAGVVIPDRPERILSGTATHTEILFALGAGEQVAAVDLWSDYPSAAMHLPRFDAFDVSIEAMAVLDPDLVIVSFDPAGVLVEGMGALGVPVLVLDAPPDLEGMFAQYADIGRAVGRVDEARDLISGMRAEIADTLAELPTVDRELTYYHELDTSMFSVTSTTFLGALYGLLGMRSIADGTGGGDFPSLTPEHVLDADPDFVFLAHTAWSGESAESVAARPGWGDLSAVIAGRVIEVDESLSSRWGPRVTDYLRSIVDVVLEATP